VLFWAVVSDSVRKAVELFRGREEAEAMSKRGIETSPTRPGRVLLRGLAAPKSA
jgi:hypothetical protein